MILSPLTVGMFHGLSSAIWNRTTGGRVYIYHPGTHHILPAVTMLSKLRTLGRKATPPVAPPLATGTASASVEEPYSTGEFSIDDYRPIKVICIGAGFSGILCAIRYAVPRALHSV